MNNQTVMVAILVALAVGGGGGYGLHHVWLLMR